MVNIIHQNSTTTKPLNQNKMNIATLEDLENFKNEIIDSLENLKQTHSFEYLKTGEVIELLGISGGTLQTLRRNKIIPYSKVGGILFYRKSDIVNLIESNFKT